MATPLIGTSERINNLISAYQLLLLILQICEMNKISKERGGLQIIRLIYFDHCFMLTQIYLQLNQVSNVRATRRYPPT